MGLSFTRALTILSFTCWNAEPRKKRVFAGTGDGGRYSAENLERLLETKDLTYKVSH